MYCYLGSGMLTNTYDENVARSRAVDCLEIIKQEVIDFDNWKLQNRYRWGFADGQETWTNNSEKFYTPEQLYNLYKLTK